MDPYSWILAVALVAVVLAAASVVLGQFRRDLPTRPWSTTAGALALGLGAIAAAVHVFQGHRPGSPEALGWVDFVIAHPTLFMVLAGAALALFLSRAGDRPAAR